MFVKFASNLVSRVYRPTFEIAISNTKERKTYVYARVLVSRNKTITKEGKITLKHVAPIRNIRSLTLFPKLKKLVGKITKFVLRLIFVKLFFVSLRLHYICFEFYVDNSMTNRNSNSNRRRPCLSTMFKLDVKMLAWIVLFPSTIRINMLHMYQSDTIASHNRNYSIADKMSRVFS